MTLSRRSGREGEDWEAWNYFCFAEGVSPMEWYCSNCGEKIARGDGIAVWHNYKYFWYHVECFDLQEDD